MLVLNSNNQQHKQHDTQPFILVLSFLKVSVCICMCICIYIYIYIYISVCIYIYIYILFSLVKHKQVVKEQLPEAGSKELLLVVVVVVLLLLLVVLLLMIIIILTVIVMIIVVRNASLKQLLERPWREESWQARAAADF